jgi:DNA-binding transcriptional regulator YbjK
MSSTVRAMPRPKDQARRRDELVAATSDVIARKGLGSVQLRDVAEAAGMTSGNVLYYYEGLDELFFAAYERAIERFCVEREAAVERVGRPANKLATSLRLGVPRGLGDTEIRLLYEFEAVAFRSPACADLMAAYVERQVDMYERILREGADAGDFELAGDARAMARNIVALEDGHGVYVLTGQVSPRELEELLLAHAAAITGIAVRALRR